MIEKSPNDARQRRWQKPDEGSQKPSRYNYDSQELFEIDQRREEPFNVEAIDLSVAGSKVIRKPGRGWVFYFYSNDDVLKAPVSGLIRVSQQQNDFKKFPARSGRGVKDTFTTLFLDWDAQPNVSADLVIFNFDGAPWPGIF